MPDLTQEGLGHLPREDVKLPPPVGYISLAEHQALIREAEARVAKLAANAVLSANYHDERDADVAHDSIRAAADTLRKDEEPK